MSNSFGIREQLQHAYAAIQNLQFDRSTMDIAEELGISRFAVGRMIRRARDEGLVEVVSRLPHPVDTQLSKALEREFGLSSALVVIPPSASDVGARAVIASIAARMVSDMVGEDDIIGLGPGRTIIQMCSSVAEIASCDVVQVTGVAGSVPEEELDAIVRLSSVSKGRMFALHAPFLTTNEEAAKAIADQPGVKNAIQRMNRLDKVVLTVGGWPASSGLATQLASNGELDLFIRSGVVAEIGTTLLDAEGKEVHSLENRLIGISTAQLRKVPLRIALGGGQGKRRAVLSVLKSGLIDVLITDQETARLALLNTGFGGLHLR
ncbi:sugar-binding transcriptional regulator [Cryobacterium sp. Hh38]|uniref:sugar-binding transcriptional regulator n=1 Tax=Cryobacterium sp. Hh38 TaxID=1259156 RepID=UPI00141B03C2|nr:sugar-binding domain-containing protein [Cryobacterium sp. Hh38]